MDIEKAITTAIDYETRVQEVYQEAVAISKNDTGKQVYLKLANEERGHIEYLKSRLDQWRKTGKLVAEKLATVIPPKDVIEDGVKRLKKRLADPDRYGELQMLGKALDVEIETSNFYRKMVDQLENQPQAMFARFLEIEEGHLALVQAEMDSLTKMGFWFDTIEFNLEGN